MGNLKWYVNRLKAMSIQEVCWRISQKRLEKEEKYLFGKTPKAVTINVFDKHIKSLTSVYVIKDGIKKNVCGKWFPTVSKIRRFFFRKQ